jgi:hypothetical protein
MIEKCRFSQDARSNGYKPCQEVRFYLHVVVVVIIIIIIIIIIITIT